MDSLRWLAEEWESLKLPIEVWIMDSLRLLGEAWEQLDMKANRHHLWDLQGLNL